MEYTIFLFLCNNEPIKASFLCLSAEIVLLGNNKYYVLIIVSRQLVEQSTVKKFELERIYFIHMSSYMFDSTTSISWGDAGAFVRGITFIILFNLALFCKYKTVPIRMAQKIVTPTAAPMVTVFVFDAFAPEVDCAFANKLAIDRVGLLVGYGMVGIGVGA